MEVFRRWQQMVDFTVSRVAPASGCPEHSRIHTWLKFEDSLVPCVQPPWNAPCIWACRCTSALETYQLPFCCAGEWLSIGFVSWVHELRPSLHLLSSCTKLDCLWQMLRAAPLLSRHDWSTDICALSCNHPSGGEWFERPCPSQLWHSKPISLKCF